MCTEVQGASWERTDGVCLSLSDSGILSRRLTCDSCGAKEDKDCESGVLDHGAHCVCECVAVEARKEDNAVDVREGVESRLIFPHAQKHAGGVLRREPSLFIRLFAVLGFQFMVATAIRQNKGGKLRVKHPSTAHSGAA